MSSLLAGKLSGLVSKARAAAGVDGPAPAATGHSPPQSSLPSGVSSPSMSGGPVSAQSSGLPGLAGKAPPPATVAAKAAPPPSVSAKAVVPPAGQGQQWSCPICTMNNNASNPRCEACDGPRPAQANATPAPPPGNPPPHASTMAAVPKGAPPPSTMPQQKHESPPPAATAKPPQPAPPAYGGHTQGGPAHGTAPGYGGHSPSSPGPSGTAAPSIGMNHRGEPIYANPPKKEQPIPSASSPSHPTSHPSHPHPTSSSHSPAQSPTHGPHSSYHPHSMPAAHGQSGHKTPTAKAPNHHIIDVDANRLAGGGGHGHGHDRDHRDSSPSRHHHRDSSPSGHHHRDSSPSGHHHRDSSQSRHHHRDHSPERIHLHTPKEFLDDKAHSIVVEIICARGLPREVCRSGLVCICRSPENSRIDVRTRSSSAAGDVVWRHRAELRDFVPGDSLEFVLEPGPGHTVSRSHSAHHHQHDGHHEDFRSRVHLNSDAFYPLGYDGELTLVAPNHGICGLLRLKITVLEGLGHGHGPKLNHYHNHAKQHHHYPARHQSPHRHSGHHGHTYHDDHRPAHRAEPHRPALHHANTQPLDHHTHHDDHRPAHRVEPHRPALHHGHTQPLDHHTHHDDHRPAHRVEPHRPALHHGHTQPLEHHSHHAGYHEPQRIPSSPIRHDSHRSPHQSLHQAAPRDDHRDLSHVHDIHRPLPHHDSLRHTSGLGSARHVSHSSVEPARHSSSPTAPASHTSLDHHQLASSHRQAPKSGHDSLRFSSITGPSAPHSGATAAPLQGSGISPFGSTSGRPPTASAPVSHHDINKDSFARSAASPASHLDSGLHRPPTDTLPRADQRPPTGSLPRGSLSDHRPPTAGRPLGSGSFSAHSPPTGTIAHAGSYARKHESGSFRMPPTSTIGSTPHGFGMRPPTSTLGSGAFHQSMGSVGSFVPSPAMRS
eukprot:TRINITY_DN2084_c0_g1_i1.p1 TRINITY_DN2084_c0_g1~~TRINITY_DN2084_c0_g1_i1.p1  ORF type:complete len:938 (-),score=50.69 TRINITY_DN2084_c0_g1_i1:164-2977(-)